MTAALAYPFDPDGTGMTSAQTIDAMRRELAHLDRRANAIRAALATLESERRTMGLTPPRESRPKAKKATKPAPVVLEPVGLAGRILATLAEAWEALTTTEIALAIDTPHEDVATELVELLYTGRVVEVSPDTWVGA